MKNYYNFDDYKEKPDFLQKVKCLFGFHVPRPNICCNECDKFWYKTHTNCVYCDSIISKKLFKIGDTIQWSFEDLEKHPEIYKGKTFQSEIVSLDYNIEAYCVYTEYGLDKIPFSEAKLIR